MSNERYLVVESNIRNLAFKLESITKSKYDDDWHSTIHAHPFTELFYVVEGKGEFIIEQERLTVQANDCIIVNPQVDHTEVSTSGMPLEYIVLGIQGLSFAQPADSKSLVPFSFVYLHDEKKEILHYLNTMVQEVTQRTLGFELICHNLLEVLLIKLLRLQVFDLDTSYSSKTTKVISVIKHYLQTHYREKIRLDDLAKLTHLSRYHIAHSFKEEIGMSPIDYLTQIRLKESKILLITTNYSIAQIASIVGFSSQSYFSEQFKKEMQMTPRQFRKQSLDQASQDN